jgi:hypothetical protein
MAINISRRDINKIDEKEREMTSILIQPKPYYDPVPIFAFLKLSL